MKELKRLLDKTELNIKECKSFIPKAAKNENFEGAIKLQGMIDAYKKVAWDLRQIIKSSPPDQQ